VTWGHPSASHSRVQTNVLWAGLRDEYYRTGEQLADEMTQLFVEHADLEREVVLQARREALRAERGALGDALRRGLIGEDVYRQLATT